ncbi:MAG: hypothetical protein ACXWK4_08995 [Myxococcaceae bacterium]
MKFLSRFQRLERARAEPGPARSATERFEALEPAAPLPDAQSAPLDRFAPPVIPPLELQPRSEAQPFVRCPACGVDSALGMRRCRCGAALDTVEAVSFNAKLWDRHRAERARLETEQQELRGAQLEAARSLQQERQALGEEIAREVAARERGSAAGGVTTVAWALMVVGLLALVVLPHGPFARILLAVLLGAVAVRAVVAWARARSR